MQTGNYITIPFIASIAKGSAFVYNTTPRRPRP